MNSPMHSAFWAQIRAASVVVLVLWQVLDLHPAAAQEALPNVRLSGPANVTACLKLPDGSMVIGGTFSSVDGVEISASLVRRNARGALMPDWAPGMKGTAECLAQDGGFLYVAGKGNATTMGSYGAVRRIRIDNGLLDPAFSIRTLAPTDRMFFGGGWLFITGNWEDSNIQAWWLGPLPAPANPVSARYSAFISNVVWAGVHNSRLLVLADGTLWSLPLPAVEGDKGYAVFTKNPVRAALLDGELLWILTPSAVKAMRPDKAEPDIVIPLPRELRETAWHLAVWKGQPWVSNASSSHYASGTGLKPALHRWSPDGIWRDIGSGLFKGRAGVLRGVEAEDNGVRMFGQFSLASGGVSFLRLNGEGDLVESHRILGTGARVRDVAFLPGGGAMVAGDFEEVDGLPQRGLFRLSPDWTLDRGWRADCDGPAEALAVDKGRVLAGGSFTGFLAAFHLDSEGRREPAFPAWNRGSVFSMGMFDGDLFTVSQSDASPATPMERAVATRHTLAGESLRELWAVEDFRIPSWREGLEVASGRVFMRSWKVLSDASGVAEEVSMSEPLALLRQGSESVLFTAGIYNPSFGRGRISLSRLPVFVLDPLWMTAGPYVGESFTPLAADGNWVYGQGQNFDRIERRSIYGQGERDEQFAVYGHKELIRVQESELLASATTFSTAATGQSALVRYLLPRNSPQPVISGHILPARANVGEVIPLPATVDTGEPVTYASSGAAAFGNGKMIFLQPGTFIVRAYQNDPPHEPAVERDRTVTARSGRALRFSTGNYLPIPSFGTANPWPSVLSLRGIAHRAAGLSVILEGFHHQSPHDLQIVLESPVGKRLLLFNLNGGKADASSFRLIFHDAGDELTDNPLPPAGLHRPVGGTPSPAMPPPLAEGPWVDSLAALLEDSPDGDWRLYAYDCDEDEHLYAGIGSWALLFETAEPAYESWVAQYFQAFPDAAAMNEDPDGDGMPNLAEYVFGTPPAEPPPGVTAFSGGGLPPVPLLQSPGGESGRCLQFTRRRNSGVTCQAEFSGDLASWIPAQAETVTAVDEDWDLVTASAPSSVPLKTAFARVRVISPGKN